MLAVVLLAAKFGVPVCPHAGGVGLCEYVQHLSMFDYVAVGASLDDRICEFVDHLHEHFVDPVACRDGRYLAPTAPGYSIEIKPESLSEFAFRTGLAGGRRRRKYRRDALGKRSNAGRRNTVKARLYGGLALVGLAGVLATAALAAGTGTQRSGGASRSASRSPATARTSGARMWCSRRPRRTKHGVSLVGPISSNGDAGKQATQIRTLIAQGVNAPIINPVDSAAIAPTLAYAASKHIPVVSVDVAPTKGKVYMIVRADNILYGQAACNYIASHANGSGHVAMLEGDLASINGLDRKNGFLNCMKANTRS